MSSLVNVRYINLPINLLYKEGSLIKAPSSLDNLRCCSIGVFIGLHPSIPESYKTSKAYFLWLRLMPLALLVTSSPKKYFREPKSFIPNLVSRRRFKFVTHLESFLVIKISSTYTKRVVKQDPLE